MPTEQRYAIQGNTGLFYADTVKGITQWTPYPGKAKLYVRRGTAYALALKLKAKVVQLDIATSGLRPLRLKSSPA